MTVWVVLDCAEYYPSGTTESVWSNEELAEDRVRHLYGVNANRNGGYYRYTSNDGGLSYTKRLDLQGPKPPAADGSWCIDEHEIDAPA